MKKKELIKIIIREFHSSTLPSYIPRSITIPTTSGKIITLVGPRRSGKTYMLYQIIDDIIKAGNSKENVLYINFEDERLDLQISEMDIILQAYRELYPSINFQKTYFFFDEIQNIKGWEKFIRRIYDSISKNIYITGSNSKLLGEEIATSLRGRTLKYEVLPLSFEEFLIFKKTKIEIPQDFYNSSSKAKLINLFHEYMTWGSFPEIVFQSDELKLKILQEYYDVMIYRDLIERYKITDTFILKYLIKRLAETITKPLSINKIYNELKSQGIKIGKNTLYEYLEYLENAFLIRKILKYGRSVVRSELSDKKAYIVDNGILRAIKIYEKEDFGILLENLMFRELHRKTGKISFYKDQKECDFVVNEKIPVQVCFDLSHDEVKKREIAGIMACCKQLHAQQGYIITFDDEDTLLINGCTYEIIPAYKWLLQQDRYI